MLKIPKRIKFESFFFSKINEQCQWFVIKIRFKIQSGQYTMSPHKIKEATTNKKKPSDFKHVI